MTRTALPAIILAGVLLSLPACKKAEELYQKTVHKEAVHGAAAPHGESAEHEGGEHHGAHKVVITSPLARDVNITQQYVCQNIILKATPKGEILKIKDVATVELGSSFYDLYSDIDGDPSAAIVLKQTPGSNASEVIKQVKKKLEEIKKSSFPAGMDYTVTYDVSNFLDASIEKVLHTLVEAIVLVSLVVYLFLGDFRSTLIPTLAVPVSLIGAFFFMLIFGMSINLITLFALVLAIGVVVEDALSQYLGSRSACQATDQSTKRR